jgi:hypothetical protein
MNRLSSGLRLVGMLWVLMAGALLQGCGGGSSSSPPPADPTGYYDVTGTASVGDGSGGTLTITDMEAMATKDRITMISAANNLLYDITINSISGDNFTGDVTVFTNGQNSVKATVKGTITSGSSITGTLTGSGVGMGNFTLNYSSQNTPLSGYYAWGAANIDGAPYAIGTDFDANKLYNLIIAASGYFKDCTMNGSITAIGNSGLYKLDVAISGCTSDIAFNGTFSGFASVQDASAKVFAFAITKSDKTRSVYEDFGT